MLSEMSESLLDCNSEFYGAYENTDAQARGEIVHPSLD
jgi:hypothetical protein